MKILILAVLAVICNVGAQVAIKLAGRPDQAATSLSTWFSPWLLTAVVLYGLSFLLTVRVYAFTPLSVASPAMAGATFLLIALASAFLLGEDLGWPKPGGMALIVLGIVLVTR